MTALETITTDIRQQMRARESSTIGGSNLERRRKDAVRCFQHDYLPKLAGLSAEFWTSRSYTWLRYGYDIEGFRGTELDHVWTFRFSRSQADFVMVSMPYDLDELPNLYLSSKSSRAKERTLALECVRLPDEWSWWYPGWTKIFTIARPEIIKYFPGDF